MSIGERPLRVLHVTKRFWPLVGGVERYVHDLAVAQAHMGHLCRVLTIDRDVMSDDASRLPRTEWHDGIQVERVAAWGGQRKQVLAEPPGRVLRLLRWADVIHHHDVRFLLETVALSRLVLRRPLLVHSHGLLMHTSAYARLKRLLVPLYLGPLLSHAVDAVIADSEADLRMLRDIAHVPATRIFLYRNALDLSRFAGFVSRPEPGRILAFGRIDSHKGHRRLIGTLRLVARPWELDIVGTGPPELVAELQAHARSLGVGERVAWHGAVDDAELERFLERAALVVFPSEFEAFGLALLEAMAAGCLVLASSIAAHQEVLGPELVACLVDFGDEAAAAGAISSSLEVDEDRRDRSSGFGRARAAEFSVDRLAGEIESLLELLQARGRAKGGGAT